MKEQSVSDDLLSVQFTVKKEWEGLWYIYDCGGRVPQCGRWDSRDDAMEEGHKYFNITR